MDGIVAGVGVPVASFADGIPFFLGSKEDDFGQVGATGERIISYGLQGIRNNYARQGGAIDERPISNARHAVWNGNARQGGAIVERITSNARHAVRDCHARQGLATGERTISNARHAAIGWNDAVLTPGN